MILLSRERVFSFRLFIAVFIISANPKQIIAADEVAQGRLGYGQHMDLPQGGKEWRHDSR